MIQHRKITEVICKILGAVPASEITLRLDLECVSNAACFRAPELMHESWRELVDLLNDRLGKPAEPWHHEVAFIVSGRQAS